MDGLTGLAAVVMFFGVIIGIPAMYTFYRVRKLRTEERLAAMQRGVDALPMAAELSESRVPVALEILLVRPVQSAICWRSASSPESSQTR